MCQPTARPCANGFYDTDTDIDIDIDDIDIIYLI